MHRPEPQLSEYDRGQVARLISSAPSFQVVDWLHRWVSSYQFPSKRLVRRSSNTPLSELDLLLRKHQAPKIRDRYFSIQMARTLLRLVKKTKKGEPVLTDSPHFLLVRMRGLEPPRCHHHRLLRPARLPVPPHPQDAGERPLCECIPRVSRMTTRGDASC